MENLSGAGELEFFRKGLASDKQQEVDMHVVDDVRDFLFGEPIPGGFDLASLLAAMRRRRLDGKG
ncbi:hypothetical protein [Candidatus Accumulibacter sp. ACC012]|jgi:hypothetical protein|nr:hypothetical protein [Candidatus Accumulibacter sp. ACC012]